MLMTLRPALLFCVALSATSFVPAQAEPTNEPLLPVVSATLPKIAIPDLLDPQGEPQLSQPADEAPEELTPETPAETSTVQEPTVTPGADLTTLVAQLRTSDPGTRELECLATGIYFESKSEPLAGQLAVGKVIANRARSGGRFPPSYCGVLFQHGQFSFIRGRSLPSVSRSKKQWQTAVAIAKIVDQGLHESAVGNALFFHARYVSPGWRLKRVASIGNHVFYR
jgi:spore germination cell wall hydrolase CwlJ-like protein